MKHLLLFACCIFAVSCLRVTSKSFPEAVPIDTSAVPLGGSFSMGLADGTLMLVYPDPNTLSLVMTAFRHDSRTGFAVGRSWHLDRLSDMPELDAFAGAHIFLMQEGTQHLFYLDRFSEGTRVLKHLIKSPDMDTPMIDVLPFQGKPISILMERGSISEIFLEVDEGLYRQKLDAPWHPLLVKKPFASAGIISTVNAVPFQGFTVFDSASRRLLLFRRRGDSMEQQVVHRAGQVHYSALSETGELAVLVYDPNSSHILLLQERPAGAGFSTQPVTLSNQTQSLSFFSYRQRLFFLFDETIPSRNRRARYQLSVLVPSKERAGLPYSKVALQNSSSPLAPFQALHSGNTLYVTFLQQTLKILRIDLDLLSGAVSPE